MPFFDMPLEDLKLYKPEPSAKPDFDVFWKKTLEETSQYELHATFEPVDYNLSTLDVFDVTFSGFKGQRVKAWLLLPKMNKGSLPCIVEYVGYGGGRGFPIDWLLYSAAGYAHFVMDTRGQGSVWMRGDTPDPENEGANPQHPGFMTRGVLSPATYYYRRLITDAVRAVEAAKAHPAIDPLKTGVTGVSQGGGIALSVSGLVKDLAFALPDVPFLCNYRRATHITSHHPYQELAAYCKVNRDKIEQVFETLSYFDGINFAARAACPALFSTALMDEICPPSTVFSAYNHYKGPKEIKVYEYNNHEGGQSYQSIEKLKFLKELFTR